MSEHTELLLAKDVDWDAKAAPCADCPFVKTSPFHEGVAGSIPNYIQSIRKGVFAHTCHKTDNREACDGPRSYKGERPKHCVGAILMLLKTGHGTDLQLPLLQAMERGDLDIKAMTAKAAESPDVFTLPELLRFYADGLQERLQTPKMKAALRKAKRRRKDRN